MDDKTNMVNLSETEVSNAEADKRERDEFEKTFNKQRKIVLGVCITSFLLIFFFGFAPIGLDSSRNGTPVGLSFFVFCLTLIVAILQTSRQAKIKRIKTANPDVSKAELVEKSMLHMPYSIVSLVCAIIPNIMYLLCVIGCFVFGLHSTVGDLFFLVVLFFYYVYIGFLLTLIWLFCGIKGLKTKKRKIAIISLIIQPVGIVVFICLMILYYMLREMS